MKKAQILIRFYFRYAKSTLFIHVMLTLNVSLAGCSCCILIIHVDYQGRHEVSAGGETVGVEGAEQLSVTGECLNKVAISIQKDHLNGIRANAVGY